jgi:predicted ATPase
VKELYPPHGSSEQVLRRVSIFGAPGAGKTVLAHELFAHYKKQGRICEVLNELAREWAYVDRPIRSMDQLFLFATQMHREDTLLTRDKCEFVITDSPVMLNAFYGTLSSPELTGAYREFGDSFSKRFRSVNIFCPIDTSFAFHDEGRFHSRDEALALERQILEFAREACGAEKLLVLRTQDRLVETLAYLQVRGL